MTETNEQTNNAIESGSLLACPDCNEAIEIDYTPGFNAQKPFERVCFACGWFDDKRYASMKDAKAENKRIV